ncbi:MAG: signal peptidase I [Candidatus Delongbacteria bacterium]|nr:signal peptidase I [bacterium]MBL7032884.1 signal peptidase I [Candidatus Delongbacteria bacterium]
MRAKRRGTLLEWLDTIVSVTVTVFLIRTLVVEAYRVPTGSMERTILPGDFLLVNKFLYGIRTPDWIGIPFTDIGFDLPVYRFPEFVEPDRGDIIVFKYPRDTDVNFIKRCVALPGDTLEIRDKQLFINGVESTLDSHLQFLSSRIIPAGYQDPRITPAGLGNKDNYGPVVVPADKYFMMGDNRDNSEDSRFWGFLPRENIVGKAWIIYFSWEQRYSPWLLYKKIRWSRLLDVMR